MRQAFPGWVRYATLISAIVVVQLIQSACKHKLASEQLTPAQPQLAADLREVTKTYLVAHVGMASFGGKSFCAFKVLDIEQKPGALTEYVYTVCMEYYLKNGNLVQGTGLGLPVALVLRREGPGYVVVSHESAGDAGYVREVERIFPKKTHEEILGAGATYTSWKVEVENEAKKYFGK